MEIKRMLYSQFKKHYPDCETVRGSYATIAGRGTIEVILPEGREKKSGTRGKHFRGYELINAAGAHVTYSATCSENALKHAEKDFPGEGWEVYTIYR